MTEIKQMFIRQIDTLNISELDRYIMDSFSDVHDVELIVLKGHILIEYTINLCIDKLAFRKAPAIIDWQFSNKLTLVEAFGLFEGDEGHNMSEQIRAITKMRNDMAHKLSFNLKEFENLIKYYPNLKGHLQKRNDNVHVSLCLNFIITFICGFVLSRLKTKLDINNLVFESIREADIMQFLIVENGMLQRHRDAINHVFQQLPDGSQ